jgi:hypothetical protein
MFFGQQKPRGLFGGGVPGISDQLPTTPPYIPPQPAMDQPAQAAPKKGVNWLHVALDALAGAGGNEGGFTKVARENKMFERQQQLAKQNRQNDWQDFQRQYDYKAAHPAPSDDSFTRALEAAGIMPGTPEYMAMARKRADMLTNPVQLVTDAMGGYKAVRPNSLDEAPPTAPVGPLTPYNGGQTGAPSGPFPR